MTGTHKPMRLPPLKVLRVKNPNRQSEQPCMAIMSSVLGESIAFPSIQTGGLFLLRVPPFARLGSEPRANSCLRSTACWASSGYNTAGCSAMEQALRACMDGPQPSSGRRSEINYHLSRFHSRVAGVKKP